MVLSVCLLVLCFSLFCVAFQPNQRIQREKKKRIFLEIFLNGGEVVVIIRVI